MSKNVSMGARSLVAVRASWMLRRAAGALTIFALALGLFSTPALATAPGKNGPIVFSSYGKIYTVQPDGSELHQVVRADEEHKYDFYPTWAPDGKRIATSGEMREPDGYWTQSGVQVFSADGTNFEHLPIAPFVENPAWSPEGARILFIRDRQLLSTTPEGAPPTHIEDNAWSPAWSPGGSRIAFIRPPDEYDDTRLYTMKAAGGDVAEVFASQGWVSSPSWSPDGSTIVFTYAVREPREDPEPWELPYTYSGSNIYAVPAAGGVPVQLTASGTDLDPVWSPDGSSIAFQSERLTVPPHETPYLFLMDADGTDERPLTTEIACLQCGPDWASLPPHPSPPLAQAPAPSPEVTSRMQQFTGMSMTRKRFARIFPAGLRFRAAIAGDVEITVRRAVPPGRVSRCAKKPSACVKVAEVERQVREGFNQIAMRGLLGATPIPGRYWLQLRSANGDADAGLAFRVIAPHHKRRK